MKEEHKVLQFEKSHLEESLRPLGSQGWNLVSCWPDEIGRVTCVFRRSCVYYSFRARSYLPQRPLELLTPSTALGICLEDGRKTKGKPTLAMPLERLCHEFGADEEAILIQLVKSGMKEEVDKQGNPKLHSFPNEHVFSVVKSEISNQYWVYASPLKKRESSSEEPRQEASSSRATSVPFSVQKAILQCAEKPTKGPKYDHSLNLNEVAREQGCCLAQALAAFQVAGLQADEGYVSIYGRQAALKTWSGQGREIVYLNVKTSKQKGREQIKSTEKYADSDEEQSDKEVSDIPLD